jgi:hypothetical protein
MLVYLISQDGNLDEFLFVSERVTEMMLEHGDFSQAEDVLRGATAFLQSQLVSSPRQGSHDRKRDLSHGSGAVASPLSTPGHSPLSPSSQTSNQANLKLDSRYFRLQLKLARLMLDSYHCERGVKLLEEQLSLSVPHNKRKSFYAALAVGHNKQWQTAECDVCLAKAQSAMTDNNALAGLDAFALAVTGVRNLLKAGRPAEALRRLDVVMRDERRLSALGQLLLLRGRVLQALAALAGGKGGPLPSGFGCLLDVVQASSESLLSAWDLFGQVCVQPLEAIRPHPRALIAGCAMMVVQVGDKMLGAKAALRYAQTRLDAVWSICVLFKRPWEASLAKTTPKSSPLPSSFSVHGSFRRRETATTLHLRGSSTTRSSSHAASEVDALGSVERAVVAALEAARSTCGDPKMLMRAHLCMAEVRWLQGRKSVSTSHFLECRDLFFGLFIGADNRFLLKDGPVSFMRSALTILHRMIRFLITLEPASINRRLEIFDAALQLEVDLGLRRQQTHKTYAAPPTEVGRRIWSLLYCIRCNGRLGASRGLPTDDLLRRNLTSLRKIYRFASASCSSTPRSVNAGKEKMMDDSPRAMGARGDTQLTESFYENSLNYDGDPEVKMIADRHVYALCILEQLVVVYCPGTGLVDVRMLSVSTSAGLLNTGVLNLLECMILGRAPVEDDGKKAAQRNRNTPVANVSSSSLSLSATESVGRTAMESSELFAMVKVVAGSLLSGKQSTNLLSSDRPAVAALPAAVKLKGKLWPKLWSPFAKLAMKFHSAPPPPIKASNSAAVCERSPMLLACSAVFRVVPWESACPGALVRTLGVTSCLATIPTPAVHWRQAGAPLIISIHSARWQGKAVSQAKLAAARGAIVREWVSGMQIGVWPPPGGMYDEVRDALSAWTCPLHSPLVKPRGLAATRRKYPWVSFLETDSGADIAGQMADSPETLVLLPYSELLRFPVGLHSELGQVPNCTVCFCPDVACKPLVRMLKASLLDPRGGPDAGKPQDVRSALLAAAKELNRDLGFPVVVLSHAWRTTGGEGSTGGLPKPTAPPSESQGADKGALKAVAPISSQDGREFLMAVGAGPVRYEPVDLPPHVPVDAPTRTASSGGESAASAQSQAEPDADAQAQGHDLPAPAGSAGSSRDGLVHTPLEVEDESTRRAFGVHRGPRSRRRDGSHGDRSGDAPYLASQALRPYARSLSAAQAAEHQEAFRRAPPNVVASARVKAMRGRVAAEMSAAHSPRYESSGAPPSELLDAQTSLWTLETESSGWLTSAEQTANSTSAEPTPRSVGMPAGEVLAEVISEEDGDDWDFDEER